MGNIENKDSLVNNLVLLLNLLGEYRIPLQKYGIQTQGIVLCNSSISNQRTEIQQLLRVPDVKNVESIRRQEYLYPHHGLYLHRVYKYDTDEDLIHFLHQDTFQAVLIYPDFVSRQFSEEDSIWFDFDAFYPDDNWLKNLESCKQYFRDRPEQINIALQQATTSELFLELKHKRISGVAMNLAIVNELYLFWYRLNYDETGSSRKFLELRYCLEEIFSNHINCDDDIMASDIFITHLYQYLDSHADISYAPCDRVEGSALKSLQTGNTILWNNKYYFISQSLLKAIYTPLTESIGERQLLEGLVNDGIIEPAKGANHNYTRKQLIATAYGPKQERFYFLPQEAIESSYYLAIKERG